jgi:phenylacetate-CoA ligase
METMPLDSWILRKMGASGNTLTRQDIQNFQLAKLNETIQYARLKSPFYFQRLSKFSADPFDNLCQISELPFTTAEDLSQDSRQFVSLPPHEISRIVTLNTSGTMGRLKRLYFTKEDLELTIDFFSSGMSFLVERGWKVLVLLPGEKPDSVGDLLARALKRIDVEGIIHGPVQDVPRAVEEISARRIDCLVGIPTQVLSLARSKAGQDIPRGMIKSVLLCTDNIPSAITDELTRTWDCRVFKHYGMTEMGLGGAVECGARQGYHLREADLLFEIVDPDTGLPLNNGETGEIVFTTLTRKGMPLIRYRTGDLSRIISESCSCGSATKRIGAIYGRLDGRITLSNGSILALPEMDEELFRVEGLLNYRTTLTTNGVSDCLEISVHAEGAGEPIAQKSLQVLKNISSISNGLADGSLRLAPISLNPIDWFTSGVSKRIILDRRNQQFRESDQNTATT